MPRCGGSCPAPRRCGGGVPLIKVIRDSLNRQRGTAYDTTSTSTVFAENAAAARAIAGGWRTNSRVSYITDPYRMPPSVLTRWETIFALSPSPSESVQARRAAVAECFLRFIETPTHQQLVDKLTAKLGSVFVALEYLDASLAVITVPDNTYPFGFASTDSPWSSTVAHMLIRTQQPAAMTWAQYLDTIALVAPVLEPIIPGWATWDFYLPGTTSVNVPLGPSAAGFYLDDPHNLDFEVFDSWDTPAMALEGYWRASYTGSPWTPTASAGASAVTGNLTGNASVGPAQNGLTPASFDGATQSLATSFGLGEYFLAGSGTIWILASVLSAPAPSGAPYTDPALLCSTGGAELGLSFSSAGFQASLFDTAIKQTTPIPFTLNQLHLFQMYWNGTQLWARVDGGTPSIVAAGAIDSAGFGSDVSLSIGVNETGSVFGNIHVFEAGLFSVEIPQPVLDTVRSALSSRYFISL